MNEFQFIDIIFLAAVAAFIAFKLRGVLGRDSGADPGTPRPRRAEEERGRVIPMPGAGQPPAPEKQAAEDILLLAGMDDPDISKALIEIKKEDHAFSVGGFLDGARTAFEWVFDAFVKKNRRMLKSLLAKDIYEDFVRELDRVEAEERRPDSTLVAIRSAEIAGAELKKGAARITVKFVSEQVTVLRDKEGHIVEGDPSRTDTVENEWVFERNLKSGNPNWTVVAT